MTVRSNNSSVNAPPYKRFSTAELKAKREKGLCYYCDEKYHTQHRCKAACYLLVGQEEIEEILQDEGTEEEVAVEEEESKLQLMEFEPKISMNALAGQFHPSTLKVTGKCGKKEVKVLVDNGSNNNFINPIVAGKLKLVQSPIMEFKVGTGSGAYLLCKSKCEGVTINIQGHDFKVDLFVLEIKGADVVLGVQWLIELGLIITDYRELTMQFNYGGQKVRLQGEDIMSPIPLKRKKLTR